MGSENLHEREEALSEGTKDMHRAIVSLMEELEAVDWYNQRAEACTDDELRAVLTHNKNEEIEHAMMTLEWIRRQNPKFDENIRTYLLSKGPITSVEAEAEGKSGGGGGSSKGKDDDDNKGREAPSRAARPRDGSLGIGSLRQK